MNHEEGPPQPIKGQESTGARARVPCLLVPSSVMRLLPPSIFCPSSRATAVGARCSPRSPPQNLPPRANAPQTLNRSIRHTVLEAAGVRAGTGGACPPVPLVGHTRLGRGHTHTQTHTRTYRCLGHSHTRIATCLRDVRSHTQAGLMCHYPVLELSCPFFPPLPSPHLWFPLPSYRTVL